MPLRLVVVGADAMPGQVLAEAAVAAGHEVRAVVQPGSAHSFQVSPRLHVVIGDAGDPAAADGMVRGADAVVIVDVPHRDGLAQVIEAATHAMHVHGVTRLLVVSGVPLPDALAGSDLDWTIVAVPEVGGAAAAGAVQVLPDGAPDEGARIPAAVVADFVLTALTAGDWRRTTVALRCES
ncbi:MAG TPA: NAD(P)H-binding protein [Vicinamibacterales bacterium]